MKAEAGAMGAATTAHYGAMRFPGGFLGTNTRPEKDPTYDGMHRNPDPQAV